MVWKRLASLSLGFESSGWRVLAFAVVSAQMGQRSFPQPSLQAHSLVKLHPFATTGLVGSKGQMNGHVIPLIVAAQKKTAQVARKRKVVLSSQHERVFSIAH